MDPGRESPPGRPRYRWPWFVLAALLLGLALAVLWMSVAVRRAGRLRESHPAPAHDESSSGMAP
jgi:F0F1-type ATP synthase assembly protein I